MACQCFVYIIRCKIKKCYFISNVKNTKNKFAGFKKMLYLCGRFAEKKRITLPYIL